MKSIEIYGDNRHDNATQTRIACRGIVVQDEMILLSYEVNTDQWFIPGGGLENCETLEACCIRELREETGYTVKPTQHVLTIHEYYEDWHFISHYFICEVVGKGDRSLTEREREVGLEPRWVELSTARGIFSKHKSYDVSDEMKRGAYLREYEALLNAVNPQF